MSVMIRVAVVCVLIVVLVDRRVKNLKSCHGCQGDPMVGLDTNDSQVKCLTYRNGWTSLSMISSGLTTTTKQAYKKSTGDLADG